VRYAFLLSFRYYRKCNSGWWARKVGVRVKDLAMIWGDVFFIIYMRKIKYKNVNFYTISLTDLGEAKGGNSK
jgi:hypothetical protein